MEQNYSAINLASEFIVGAFSHVMSETLNAPIKKVKFLLQTQGANPKLVNKKYNGVIDCFRRCVREDGFFSLWRGNWPAILRYFPSYMLKFGFKDTFAKMFNPFNPRTDPGKYFVSSIFSGGLAGATSLLVIYPLDFARVRLAVDLGKEAHERQFQGLLDCWRKIYRSDGIIGLYRGCGTSVFGIFLYRGIYFGGYDLGKRYIFPDSNRGGIFVKFAFAQFITIASGFLTYPIDTIAKRLMMQSGRSDVLYTGAIQCARKILREEGITAFFRAYLMILITGIAGSVTLVLYDEIMSNVRSGKY